MYEWKLKILKIFDHRIVSNIWAYVLARRLMIIARFARNNIILTSQLVFVITVDFFSLTGNRESPNLAIKKVNVDE